MGGRDVHGGPAGLWPDANGVRLRDVAGEIYGIGMRGDTSALYHLVGFIRIDRFDGKDLKLVQCAHDVAAAPSGNPIFLSCDNGLGLSVNGRQLTVVRTQPTLPVDRTPGTSSWDLIEADSGHVIVALNTASKPNDARCARDSRPWTPPDPYASCSIAPAPWWSRSPRPSCQSWRCCDSRTGPPTSLSCLASADDGLAVITESLLLSSASCVLRNVRISSDMSRSLTHCSL